MKSCTGQKHDECYAQLGCAVGLSYLEPLMADITPPLTSHFRDLSHTFKNLQQIKTLDLLNNILNFIILKIRIHRKTQYLICCFF